MDFEQILRKVGPFGRHQKLVVLILSLPLLLTTLQLFVQVFTAGKGDHWCKTWPDEPCDSLSQLDCAILKRNKSIPSSIDADGNIVYDQCSKFNVSGIDFQTAPFLETGAADPNATLGITPCDDDDGWVYDTSIFSSTVIIDFDLVCGKSFLPNVAQSAYFAGFLVGSLLAGPIADLIGRRSMLLVSTLLTGLFGLAVSFSANIWMFIVLRFLTAAFAVVTMIYGVVLSNEIVEASKRIVAANFLCVMFAIGYVVLAGLAKIIHKWRMLQLAVSIPYFIVCILIYFLVPESPLWLISKGRQKDAEIILRSMARINGKKLPDSFTICSSDEVGEKTENDGKTSFFQLFLSVRFTLIVFDVGLVWLIHSFAYYGLSLSTSTLGIDPYVSFLVSGAIEIPAYVVCMFVPEIFGRKPSALVILLLGGSTCCLTALFDPGLFRALLAMVGKAFVTMSYALVVCWGMEIVPTLLRSSGYGFFSACSRIGGIIAPLFLILEETWYNLPAIIFGAVTISAAFLCLFLPETKGVALPSTVEDIEKLHKLKINVKHTVSSAEDVRNVAEGDGKQKKASSENAGFEDDVI